MTAEKIESTELKTRDKPRISTSGKIIASPYEDGERMDIAVEPVA